VANIRPQKNHEIAIEALAKLNQHFSVKLHLLGQYNKDDGYYQSLLKLIKHFHLESNIEFYGSVENVQVYLSQADIAILSSRSEGLPLSLIEYAMAEKPIIVTDVGQCQAVVGDFAKVVPKANAKALTDAIIYYLTHQDQAQQDANQLYKKVTKEYGAEAITDDILTLYKRL
jgi:glycosyltransferase involved in cell wall biosynthesis